MPTIALGIRRLYDALGFDPTPSGDFRVDSTFHGDVKLTVYLGPSPVFGIRTVTGDEYGIPGRKSLVLHSDDKYSSNCFLEIAFWRQHELTQHELNELKQQRTEIQQELLKQAEVEFRGSEALFDAVSGTLGLCCHKQLVLKLLIEDKFLSGDFPGASSFYGPVVEMLEPLSTNARTQSAFQQFIDAFPVVPEEELRRRGAILHWLVKAWREKDIVARFMYLFIPLEAVLPSSPDLAREATRELDRLREIVENTATADRPSLLDFIERTRSRFSPSLSARFEDLARRAMLPGWEVDVQAFKKFNRMRNLLLHSGNRSISIHLDLQKNTRTLEDLIERYVAFVLLGSTDVYPSRWRPLSTLGADQRSHKPIAEGQNTRTPVVSRDLNGQTVSRARRVLLGLRTLVREILRSR
jgi:hypothetical protein